MWPQARGLYQGRRKSTPGYYCTGTGQLVEGRGLGTCGWAASASMPRSPTAFLAALAPAGLQACLDAAEQLETGVDAACSTSGAARSNGPDTGATRPTALPRRRPGQPAGRPGSGSRLGTRAALLADAEAELARREARRPKTLTPQEKTAILAFGDNLAAAWDAPTTTDRDRKVNRPGDVRRLFSLRLRRSLRSRGDGSGLARLRPV